MLPVLQQRHADAVPLLANHANMALLINQVYMFMHLRVIMY